MMRPNIVALFEGSGIQHLGKKDPPSASMHLEKVDCKRISDTSVRSILSSSIISTSNISRVKENNLHSSNFPSPTTEL